MLKDAAKDHLISAFGLTQIAFNCDFLSDGAFTRDCFELTRTFASRFQEIEERAQT